MFTWNQDYLSETYSRHPSHISKKMVETAIAKMKSGMAAGSPHTVIEMIKAPRAQGRNEYCNYLPYTNLYILPLLILRRLRQSPKALKWLIILM